MALFGDSMLGWINAAADLPCEPTVPEMARCWAWRGRALAWKSLRLSPSRGMQAGRLTSADRLRLDLAIQRVPGRGGATFRRYSNLNTEYILLAMSPHLERDFYSNLNSPAVRLKISQIDSLKASSSLPISDL
jgi:hypothetical protein